MPYFAITAYFLRKYVKPANILPVLAALLIIWKTPAEFMNIFQPNIQQTNRKTAPVKDCRNTHICGKPCGKVWKTVENSCFAGLKQPKNVNKKFLTRFLTENSGPKSPTRKDIKQ